MSKLLDRKRKVLADRAMDLMSRGSRTLARMEDNGIRVDVGYLDKTIADAGAKIASTQTKLKASKLWTEWKKRHGNKAKLGSLEQLADLLYNGMGYPCEAFTATGRPKADESAMEKIDLPFIRDYIRMRKLMKAKSTYLEGIRREVIDSLLHPVYNLHLTESFRSSSDTPNFQNMPVRNAEVMEMIRRCFIPRKGRRLVEIDYSGIEVRIAYCYHKDPVMRKYLTDPTTDMHRDMAAECFLLDPSQVSKKARYAGKNMFVFPAFYGSYYVDIARNLWEGMERLQLKVEGTDVTVREHLACAGITRLGACDPDQPPKPGTFEHHIQQVEKKFWGERFRVYDKWKKTWWEAYQRAGYFQMYSGFLCHGVYRKNQVINLPVQGAAFHCLLWSLIELDEQIRKYKWKSLLVGQIHDSALGDVVEVELQDYLSLAHEIMTERLPKAWDWISIPLETESEVCDVKGDWTTKKVWVPDRHGVWSLKA